MTSYRNKIYQWQGDSSQPYNNFIWKSRKYIYPYRVTFNCARIIAETGDRQDYYESIETRKRVLRRNHAMISGNALGGAIGEDAIGNVAINGDGLETVPTVAAYSGDYNLTVKIYVDGTLHFTKEVYASDIPFRIPGGVRGRTFEVQIEGNVIVKRLDMATSMKELMQ